jgi:hypothetical protein
MKIQRLLSWDELGIAASTLCMIHCLATPVLILVLGLVTTQRWTESSSPGHGHANRLTGWADFVDYAKSTW